jgi:ABC-type nickel/cobalt efflux system permease component RcnA
MDADGDGALSLAEQEQGRAALLTQIGSNLRLTVDGAPLPLAAVASRLEFPAGQAGLPTLRLTADFAAPLARGRSLRALDYADGNYSGRLGWQEIVAVPAAGVELDSATVPATDRSDELRAYPADLLNAPPTVSAAEVEFRITGAGSAAPPALAAAPLAAPRAGDDPFARLILAPAFGPFSLLAALAIAFAWGAAHAMSPGHGKTIAAAYLVGTRGTVRHALILGVTTTATHTLGVFALGLATLLAAEYVLPERLYPWLGVVSGVLVVAIGLSLARTRLWRARRSHPHDYGHEHGYEHDHDHAHDHEHAHDHDHAHDRAHDHSHDHPHAHGGHTHNHLPPGADGRPVTLRSLLLLGVSGGLLPCPSALVLMLGAIAQGRAAFGLLLVICFSLGLAGVLSAIGVLLVVARAQVHRIPAGLGQAGLLRFAPAASAVAITLAGVVITWQSLAQAGLFPAI